MPKAVSERIRNYAVAEFDNDYSKYSKAIDENNLQVAKVKRDELVFRLKRNIDSNYADFENNLFLGKASSNVLFDIAELGSAAAVGITNGERAKSIIGTALTAFKGGRKSVDVNFFREKTTESLILTMRASRSGLEEKINLGLRNGVTNYTLEEALGDLIDYFYAGSLANALLRLSQTASEDAKIAKEEADKSIKDRLKTEFTQSVSIDSIRNQLSTDLSSKDGTTQSAARTRLIKVLEALRISLPDMNIKVDQALSNDQLFSELQRVLKAAALRDPVPTEAILDALKEK